MGRQTAVIGSLVAIGVLCVVGLYFASLGVKATLKPNPVQRVGLRPGLSPFRSHRAYEDLKAIVALGPRVPGTEGSAKVRSLITRKLEEAGLDVRVHEFEAATPLGPRHMANVIGVVQGEAPGIIILGTHYDSKYLPDIRFLGANDGASTTAWMLEFARTVGPSRKGLTLWLCFYDGEEAFKKWTARDSLYGSRELVAKMTADGSLGNVKALINLDMIGDCFLGIFKDRDAPQWLTEAVWGQAAKLGYGRHFLAFSQAVQDDHLPFRESGVPAVNLIDFRYGGSAADHRRNWHTENDTIDRVCPESLQAVGDVMFHAIVDIERKAGGKGHG